MLELSVHYIYAIFIVIIIIEKKKFMHLSFCSSSKGAILSISDFSKSKSASLIVLYLANFQHSREANCQDFNASR